MLVTSLLAGAIVFLTIANACADRAQVDSTPSSSAEAADPSALSSTPEDSPTVAGGFLEGSVSIGPLHPGPAVVGASPATPPPEACTSRGLVVRTNDTGIEVARVSFMPDCTYRVSLAAGIYQVELAARGIDRSAELPAVITITPEQTTRLDLNIDTGLR